MRIFEFHFNPKAKKDRFFKTFSFEKVLVGKDFTTNVYGIGELSNVLPQNSSFLDTIAHVVSEEYGESSDSPPRRMTGRTQGKSVVTPEIVFKKALREVDSFLLKEKKQGNVDWLGNLHLVLVAFSFFPRAHKVTFSLAKSGNTQVFLARKNQLVNIAKDKTLESAVVGKLFAQDKLIVATHELSSFLESRDLLRDFAFLKEQKQYQELLKQKEKELHKVAGVLFVGVIEELPLLTQPKRNPEAFLQVSFFRSLPLSAKKKIVLVVLLYAVLMLGSLLFK
ncbi:MAG: hypothetical protein Greene071421_120 [Parcubacteria group bacterium Greene0714_21]|nr:MAG: hypothetical protein Greene041639_231 [Parcubacteria group bacterium Greene0416_39]TSC98523.1 MAG: hypothetical protein Greene101447_25 [Parcubacteria group bacterium Greene1014_47]TSD04284.1 MAG: hypothetical protein Greene071421_120 [Parcubacteria group bacterium Greene0714_21]